MVKKTANSTIGGIRPIKFCVLFESATGNTRLVAEKIHAALHGGQARLLAITPDIAPPEEDILFIGFWANKGTCPPATSELLGRLSGKKVALFGTAGFGGSPEYFEGIAERARAGLPEGNGLLDVPRQNAPKRTRPL